MNVKTLSQSLLVAASILLLTACQSEMPPEAGEVNIVDGRTYVWVPAGSFQIGSRLTPDEIQDRYGFEFTQNAKDGWHDQLPLTEAPIERGFWLARHEVTVAEFRAFTDATGYRTEAERDGWGYGHSDSGFGRLDGVSWLNPGWEQDDTHPVVLISWNDANAYIGWMNGGSDGRFRLPTEAEWEYAARAGTDSNFYWGDETGDAAQYANVLDSFFDVDDGYARTAPVGYYLPNAWGLNDMVGNVWEWTSSAYSNGYGAEPDENSGYVDRGGGWDSPPYNARIANRGAGDDGFRAVNLGLRLVYSPEADG